MLKWIKGHFKMDRPDEAVIWAALNTGFSFLLRAGEYVKHDKGEWNHRTALNGSDVELRAQGEHARRGGPQPDEVVIRIRGSKNAQLNVGEVRNHHAYGGDLCVVSAIARLRHHFPARFDGGPEAGEPLFRWQNGTAVTRTDV